MGAIRSRKLAPDEVACHRAITDALREFAGSRDLDYTPYFHDELLWILSDRLVRKGFVARLQVGLIMLDGAERLSFVESVSYVDLDRLVSKAPKRGTASHRPLDTIYEGDDFRQVDFREFVERRWSSVEARRNLWLKEPPSEDGWVEAALSEHVASMDLGQVG